MDKLKVVNVPIGDIKPYEKNPRKNDATVQKLVNVIKKVGFNQPILLDSNNVIVKGHARYAACKQLGFETIPCVYTDNSEDLVRFNRIADNKVHEFTSWDKESLDREVDSLDIDFDLSDLGISASTGFDFVDGYNEPEIDADDDEERKRRYMELMEKMVKASVQTLVITTQADIDKAQDAQAHTPKPKELIPIKCECCGKILYVQKNKYFEM